MSPQAGFQPPSQAEESLAIARTASADAAIFRVGVELARQYPRNEGKVLTHLLATLDTYPMFAEKALYSIPYRDNRTGATVRVEGLSIRAAETMATAWGHLQVGVRILGEDENGWDLEAAVWDMETNYRELMPARASKWLKMRDGRMQLLDERQQVQARGAAASKIKRNCVLAVLPMHLKAAFETRVREKIAGGPLAKAADKTRVAKCLEVFGGIGVTADQLVAYVGKPRDLWTGGDLADLLTLFNAIEDGETTVKDAFPAVAEAPAPPAGRVVEAADGALAPEQRQAPPAPAPDPTPAVDGELIVREADIARLRRELAEAEAREAQAAMPRPGPAPAPAAPAPAPAPAADAASVADRMQAEIAACETIEALDAFLGRLYQPGGPYAGIKREEKRAALAKVGERRDAIARTTAK